MAPQQDPLTIVSIIATLVLAFISVWLSMKRNVHFFIVVGQTVFMWLAVVLITLLATRAVLLFDLITIELARVVTGVVYIVAVLGILVTVSGHARNKQL